MKTIWKKWTAGVLTVMIAALGFAGCSSSKASQKETGKATEIKIGTMDLISGDLVARAEKYYEKELGVDVKILRFDSGKDVNAALAAGSIDVSELGSNPTAMGISNGLNYDVIYISNIIGSGESLVVKNSANIKSFQDLKGKKIATPFASTAHYSLLNALKLEEISEKDVKLLDMEPDDIHAAWNRGDIDAAYVWDPVLSNLLKDGIALTGGDKLAKKGLVTADLVVARQDFEKANPELVKKFIQVLNKANQLDQSNPDKVINDIADVLKISKEDAKLQRKGYEWIQGEDQLKENYLGGHMAEVLKNTADFLVKQASIKKAPDLATFKKHINITYLEDALKK